MFPFSKLQTAMTRLRFKDESALRDIGLAKLSKTFDAYPLMEEGGKIYVLLPRGMDPVEARQLNDQGAVKKVVVLAQRGNGVAKVWPSAASEVAVQAPVQAVKPAPEAVAIDFEIVEED